MAPTKPNRGIATVIAKPSQNRIHPRPTAAITAKHKVKSTDKEAQDATRHKIRRILGERKKGSKTEYLVEWLPSWETSGGIFGKGKKAIMGEWEEHRDAKQEARAFLYRPGTNDITAHIPRAAFTDPGTLKNKAYFVLRDNVPSENVHEEMCRQMFEVILEKFKLMMAVDLSNNPWMKQFKEKDWAFAQDMEAKAKEIAGEDITAASVLRHTYREIAQMVDAGTMPKPEDFESDDLDYATIKVHFIGQIDGSIKEAAEIDERPAIHVHEFVLPLFPHGLREIEAESMSSEETCGTMTLWLDWWISETIKFAPYILRNPWCLFLTRLFRTTDKLSSLLTMSGIEISEEWGTVTRDYLSAMYRDEVETEFRSTHDIQDTYCMLRDNFHDIREEAQKEQDGEDYKMADTDDSDVSDMDGEGIVV